MNNGFHIHVGSNMPGCLPEGEPACFSNASFALDFLEDEIRDQQAFYWDSCESETPETCECSWCDAASDCEAAIAHIADGDAHHAAMSKRPINYLMIPDHGPDMAYWLTHMDGPRGTCELNEDL